MKEKTPFMAHQPSSESNHQITSQPLLNLNKPIQPKNVYYYMEQLEKQGHKEYYDTQRKTHLSINKEITLQEQVSPLVMEVTEARNVEDKALLAEVSGRERLKRHRVEVAGRVWIPEIWGQEEHLKDWIDCTAFDAPLVPSRIMMAKAALVQEGTRASAIAGGFRLQNRC